MKTRYEIEVTQSDIDTGVRRNSSWCMATTAIERDVLGSLRVVVDAQTVRFSLPENVAMHRFVYLTPRAIRDYIISFDAGEDPKPFSFVLDKPVSITEMPVRPKGAAKTYSFKPKGKGTGERRSLRVFGERAMRINQEGS